MKECKRIQLEILDEIDAFCKKHGLKYSLAYGTLIGAVRHKGYIPWDDDIDIIMPRPDYEKFIGSFNSNDNFVQNLSDSNVCIEIFTKVSRKGTIMRDRQYGRELWGVNVDIFPIDGAPEDDLDSHYEELLSLYSWVSRLCPFYKVVGSGSTIWFIKYLLKRLKYPHLGNCRSIKKEIHNRLLEHSFTNSPLAGAYFGDDGIREFMPRVWFQDFTTLKFEGKDYFAITNYDAYLRRLFENYMELPPEEKRCSHHLYDSFIEE